ncbi:glycosyltransferase family 1 protein [Moniliophthora roreri MCA 2997]|uniref:UDP-N-acetylglucosamine transferase subunit ALG14 n=1 Tax=Moniliophthora roreri (strain MCA 2997) TaxID=1381753 RepID=V2XW87_MONRO|nr:glycosyltransferase family 1 protein [Moniliophthora roreri MCA 2997]KAI3618847.1 hypothetical protein WG66_000631 [Moniliophthora roreri]
MGVLLKLFASASILFVFACVRIYIILPGSKPKRSITGRTHPTAKLAVFLGSGGHTSEAISLLSALDFERYTPRIYVVSEGDSLSVQKAQALESKKIPLRNPYDKPQFKILTVPRARKVHQPLFTTPLTASFSLLKCIYYVTVVPLTSAPNDYFSDVLIVNGPGTCFVLCLAVFLNKFLGLQAPRVIYVESFARVKSLSLSGKLLQYIVDRFIVQWPTLLIDRKRGECHGWLV